MIDKLYAYRFELVFINLVALLFGSLVIPPSWYESVVSPVLVLLFILMGMVFISKRKRLFHLFAATFVLTTIVSVLSFLQIGDVKITELVRASIVLPYFVIVTYELIRQIWVAEVIDKNAILGVMSGYMCLGFIGTLLFMTIETVVPGSFYGNIPEGTAMNSDDLLYLSYITLMSIGYGDFGPVTVIAKKASMLIGTLGQFYMVIIIAVVVSKYVNTQDQSNAPK